MDTLPEAYWDFVTPELATPAERGAMSEGCHYDYQAQAWRDGHDHAHVAPADASAPLLFCGADVVTCLR